MYRPKVSIVTTTYNDRESLKKTIDQVLRQDYGNLEYIIVDGGSTDGTLEVIREAEDRLGGRLCWISEPDSGIYDGLNKGFRMATGEILGCCFDEFAGPDVISKMVELVEREGTDGVHGDLCYMEGERVVRRWHQGQGHIRYGWMPGHPTLYLRREVYETYGYYKTDYRISADYEFMIRCSSSPQPASSCWRRGLSPPGACGSSRRTSPPFRTAPRQPPSPPRTPRPRRPRAPRTTISTRTTAIWARCPPSPALR